MFKFLVLCAVVAAASAAPGFLHGGIAVAAPAAVAVPALATSHTSRTDIVHPSVAVATVSHAPAIAAVPAVAAAPVAIASAPALGYGGGHLGLGGIGLGGIGLGGIGGYGGIGLGGHY